ncbi:hypothetical protein [Isobaculum melis]|uniref:MucBP domain-containing protein n=1 Tax=Isobaculum melis TaxID=142588 RepID=A0A1H9UIT1_9LACT|nr:hypothetical protein [Isobaculum melis]SES09272.1 hypothetical protein SAMN04488559_13214 [Isobaculum melis]
MKKTALVFLLIGILFVVQKNSIQAEEAQPKKIRSDIILSSSVPQHDMTNGGIVLFDSVGKYSVGTLGNSNNKGAGVPEWHTWIEYIDVDNDPTTFSSSSMDYIPKSATANVVKAYLSFSESQPINRDETFILGPSGGKFKIDDGVKDVVYDITEFMQQEGAGTYWGKNITMGKQSTARDAYANWNIAYIEEDPHLDSFRKAKLSFFGETRIGPATKRTYMIDKDRLPIKKHGDITGNLALTVNGAVAGELIASSAGDTLTVDALKNGTIIKESYYWDDMRPIDDIFRGATTYNSKNVTTRQPARQYGNTDIINLDFVNLNYFPPGMDGLQVSITTGTGDAMGLEFFGLSIDLDIPIITLSSSELVTNATEFTLQSTVPIKTIITPSETKAILHEADIQIKLPVGILMKESSLLVNGVQVPFEYRQETNTVVVSVGEVGKAEITLQYEIEDDSFIEANQIQTTLMGKIVSEMGDKTDIKHQASSNALLVNPDSVMITEKYVYLDKTEFQKNTQTEVIKGTAYEQTIPEIEGYIANAYQIEGNDMQMGIEGDPIKIEKVTKDETIYYIYQKKGTLNVKQMILNETSNLVIPKQGYITLNHQTDGNLNAVVSSAVESELAYTKITFGINAQLPLYAPGVIVPSYYQYEGFYLTDYQTEHRSEQRNKNQLPEVNYQEKSDYWLTIYLAPTTQNPRPYSWGYR